MNPTLSHGALTLTFPGKAEVLWTYTRGGRSLNIPAPLFEINGSRRAASVESFRTVSRHNA